VQLSEAQTIFNPIPSRIAGQALLQQQGLLTAIAPNLVEGREFNNPQAVAIDTSATPPILYVADFGNNRVLAWRNAFGFAKGDFAAKVIGQRDLLSTAPQGPGADLSTGLFAPVALAVDSSGNLYVADAGNNRILRYPSPLLQTGDLLTVDLIVGQKDLNGRAPNEGQSAPSEKTVAFATATSTFRAGLAFDAQGNLWVSDPGNNRALRFPVSSLGGSATNEPAADLVLGQTSFTSNTIPANATRNMKNFLAQPSGLAFDPRGRLFVADAANRVVVYTPPLFLGQPAARILGVILTPNPPQVNESTLGALASNGAALPPEGVFFVGGNPYVADTGNARILGYDPFDQWPDESVAFSPPAKVIIGQRNFQTSQSNQGIPQPSDMTLAGPQPNPNVGGPVAGVFAGTDLFVVDSGNNRVMVFPQSAGQFTSANRLLGQLDFQYNAPNLIEGREVGFSGNITSCIVNGALPFSTGGSAVIDTSSNPPHLYVADPLNNRVLGYLDYRKVNAGATADVVIGQPDLRSSVMNYPTNSATRTTDQGLWSPEGIAVDSAGNLYVADTCNARVLRFPAPFNQPPNSAPHANLVLGQTSFIGQPIKDVSRQTMKSAYGVAFTADGHLVVSDPLANRILFFRKPTGGDFQSGQPAANVFGQPNFSSSQSTVLSGPHLIALDPDDQLYVADTGNNRIAILPNVPTAGDNPPVLFSITGLSNPYGVFLNQSTYEIWVTDTNGNKVLRYPNFQSVIGNLSPSATLNVFGPVSIALDPFGNPVIAEGATNRVSFYYPAIDFTTSAGGVPARLSGNSANYFGRFAPGMLASIFAFPNSRFGDQTATSAALPLPATLGDVQVLVAGAPAPLLSVSPGQINFQVPSATPVGGLQEIQVLRASTGQVLASWLFRTDAASPGLLTANGTGSGQVSASNEDGTVNNGSHPAKAGSIVSLFATGQGVVDGMPPDGQIAQGTIYTSRNPRVFINSDFVPDGDVQFSGLAPGYVGLWQINVKVPANVPPGDVIVFITYDGINSILDPNGIRRTTTIRTAP
jgi:uncharacterized protein (TIGR03437 family)